VSRLRGKLAVHQIQFGSALVMRRGDAIDLGQLVEIPN
jgi:hypothetical protein